MKFTAKEIIKYLYKPSIIRLLIAAIFAKRDAEIEELWELGWFTPEEYDLYKDKELDYDDMIAIYNRRKVRFAERYITNSYNQGYLDAASYEDYVVLLSYYDEGSISYGDMEQAMYIVLQIIKNNRLQNYDPDNE